MSSVSRAVQPNTANPLFHQTPVVPRIDMIFAPVAAGEKIVEGTEIFQFDPRRESVPRFDCYFERDRSIGFLLNNFRSSSLSDLISQLL